MGPTHTLPLPVPALLHWAPLPLGLLLPLQAGALENQEAEEAQAWSLQGTAPSPGTDTWLGGGCPVLALPRVRRGSWSWGEPLRTRTGVPVH